MNYIQLLLPVQLTIYFVNLYVIVWIMNMSNEHVVIVRIIKKIKKIIQISYYNKK